MDLIVEMRFGAHLYGTATPDSDLDLKGVYLPEAKDILLQRVQPTVSLNRSKGPREKNVPGDVDREVLSLQRYLELLAEGQTMALDMLFAPDAAMIGTPSRLWRDIQAMAPRLISRQASAFVRYCRQQADKYGIKGSRVSSAKAAYATLREAEMKLGANEKLAAIGNALDHFAATTPHAEIVEARGPGGRIVRHFEICGRKMPFTASIKNAREIAERLVGEYGQRALAAESNEGVDWKALSHAVRVANEALELLNSGHITFPLPNAAHILQIKQGQLPYRAVATEIETLIEKVDAARLQSPLPNEPDHEAIDNLVSRAYRSKCCG